MTATVLERGLRRDRVLVIGGLAAVVALSWAYVLAGAGMGMHDMPGMIMDHKSAPWALHHAAVVLGMWAIMMAAMMLPSAAPVILLYGTVARRRAERGGTSVSSGVFAAGYLLAWTGFSVGATALQYGLEQAALLTPMSSVSHRALAGAVLIGAGLYQWTPLKHACLRRCRSPLDFILSEWREGRTGALVMGARHGAYCVGCCWALMLLLFVGGVMNLAWIGAIALFVLVEKLARRGNRLGQVAGAGLVIWGGVLLLQVF
jgi:predicted metal-binding membrane protein